MLEADSSQIPAYLEVRYGWRNAKSVRLVIQDKVIVSEGEFKTAAQPALPVPVCDYSTLDDKPLRALVLIVLVLLYLALLIPTFSKCSIIESSARLNQLQSSVAALAACVALFFSFKFPQRVDALMGAAHQFLSERQKLLNRSLMSIAIGLLVWMIADIWIPVINDRFHDGTPLMLQGVLKDNRNEFKDAQFVVQGRTFTLPTNSLTAFGATDEAYEVVGVRGSLGFYLAGSFARTPEMSVFLLENFTQPKWIRKYHVETAVKLRDTDWLKGLASKWEVQCDSGLSNYCRLASYYHAEIHSAEAKTLLMKACDGADPIGCYGLTESADASETEKKSAALTLLTLAREAKASCQCFWPTFDKYVDAKTLESAKHELCAGRPKWVCP